MNNREKDRDETQGTDNRNRNLRIFRYRTYQLRQGIKSCLMDMWWDFRRELRKMRFLVEIIGVAVLIVYTIYTARMYEANRHAADAARSAAETARTALNKSIESFRIDERAWIVIEPPTPKIKIPASSTYGGALFTYDFFLKNVGKTAAFNIAVKAPRAPVDGALSFGDSSATIGRVQETLQIGNFFNNLSLSDEIILLSERNAKTLAPGVRAFSSFQLYGQEPRFERYRFLIGRIDYEDAFSVNHWSTFCFFVDTGGDLRYCREGNNEDKNPEFAPDTKR